MCLYEVSFVELDATNSLQVLAAKVPVNHLGAFIMQIMLIVIFNVTANNVNPFCLRDVCVKGVAKSTWSEICVLSIKLKKSVVSFRCKSCFC